MARSAAVLYGPDTVVAIVPAISISTNTSRYGWRSAGVARCCSAACAAAALDGRAQRDHPPVDPPADDGDAQFTCVRELLEFNRLKAVLGISDGNMSTHLTTLEKVGYIRIAKDIVGKKTPHPDRPHEGGPACLPGSCRLSAQPAGAVNRC